MADAILKQNKCVVYWLYDEACSVPENDGYVGITDNLARRIRHHRQSKRFVSKFQVLVLFEGTRAECVQREYLLRPHGNIGWNIGQGGAYTKGYLGKKHSAFAKAIMRSKKLGRRHTPESKAKMMGRPMPADIKAMLVRINTGSKRSDDQRVKMSAAQLGNKKTLGRKQSAEEIAKRAKTLLGKKRSAEQIERIREGHLRFYSENRSPLIGFKHSDKTRANMSAAHLGKTLTTEQRAKIGAANKGRPKPAGFGIGRKFSEETRRKISESVRRRWSLKQKEKSDDPEDCGSSLAEN